MIWGAFMEMQRTHDDLARCWCHACNNERADYGMRMIVCPTCGNKRCPKANNHAHTCTSSNDPGQPGSAY